MFRNDHLLHFLEVFFQKLRNICQNMCRLQLSRHCEFETYNIVAIIVILRYYGAEVDE